MTSILTRCPSTDQTISTGLNSDTVAFEQFPFVALLAALRITGELRQHGSMVNSLCWPKLEMSSDGSANGRRIQNSSVGHHTSVCAGHHKKALFSKRSVDCAGRES
jgi:hypothetical protein